MSFSARARAFIRSNVMGIIALYVALGGTALALHQSQKARSAPKNSVVSRSIKNHQVKSIDIARNAAGGPQVNESSLGTVPTAANAAKLGGQAPSAYQSRVINSCSAGQAIRVVSADGTVTCENGGGPPSGSAGGDLAGTYPSPQIAPNAVDSGKINNASITAADLGLSSVVGGPAGTVQDDSITGADVQESSLDNGVLQSRVSNVPCAAGSAIANIAASGAASCVDTLTNATNSTHATNADALGSHAQSDFGSGILGGAATENLPSPGFANSFFPIGFTNGNLGQGFVVPVNSILRDLHVFLSSAPVGNSLHVSFADQPSNGSVDCVIFAGDTTCDSLIQQGTGANFSAGDRLVASALATGSFNGTISFGYRLTN